MNDRDKSKEQLIEELLETRRRYRNIIDTAQEGIIMTDARAHLVFANQHIARMLGLTPEEMLGRPVFDFMDDLSRTVAEHCMLQLREGKSLQHDFRFRRKDGTNLWAIVSSSPVFDEGNAYMGSLCMITDITERKKMEQALIRAETKFRTLVEYSLTGIYLIQGGKFQYVNPKLAEIFGYTQEEIIALPSVLDLVAANSRDLVAENIRKRMEGEAQSIQYIFQGRKRDGSIIDVEALGTRIDFDGRPAIIGNLHDITERKRMEETIKHQAYYDLLTDLPNKTLFIDRLNLALTQAHRNRQMLAVLFLDLDRFKNINDSLGHAAGDLLLKAVADRLKSCVRETDTVARIGGDEYAIILSQISREEDITVIAKKVIASFKEPYAIDDHLLHSTVSIGISLYPNDGEYAGTLLKNADLAMYHAKELGRNNYQFYSPALNIRTLERIILENALRRTLERGELVVYYQPQVDIATRRILCVEALVRWQHPDLGLLNPLQFIPLAEETGFIVSLDEWVLRTACAQSKAWQNAGLPPVCITVNLSSCQFQQQNLVEMVMQVVRETELDPSLLNLEITESTAMQQIERAIPRLAELSAKGIHFSIDDFGTGYSSLSYLKRLPVRKIKIDKSFITDVPHNPDDMAIITAIIAMAHKMKLFVIAEGVETEEQLSFLRSSECDGIQGYLVSEPLPAEEFEALVLSNVQYHQPLPFAPRKNRL